METLVVKAELMENIAEDMKRNCFFFVKMVNG